MRLLAAWHRHRTMKKTPLARLRPALLTRAALRVFHSNTYQTSTFFFFCRFDALTRLAEMMRPFPKSLSALRARGGPVALCLTCCCWAQHSACPCMMCREDEAVPCTGMLPSDREPSRFRNRQRRGITIDWKPPRPLRGCDRYSVSQCRPLMAKAAPHAPRRAARTARTAPTAAPEGIRVCARGNNRGI